MTAGAVRSDEALTVGAVQGPKNAVADGTDFGTAHHAGQALRVIEGEAKAAEYLARLKTQQADPDELALIVSMLYGATLRGFCRVIEKAVRHG